MLSAAELHDLLLEAAETERRLPPALKKTPTTWWPDILPEWLSYASDATTTRLSRATAKQIDNYDLCLDIVVSVPVASDRTLLWSCAQSAAFRDRGIAWSKIGRVIHKDRRKVKSMYEQLLWETADRWNAICAKQA